MHDGSGAGRGSRPVAALRTVRRKGCATRCRASPAHWDLRCWRPRTCTFESGALAAAGRGLSLQTAAEALPGARCAPSRNAAQAAQRAGHRPAGLRSPGERACGRHGRQGGRSPRLGLCRPGQRRDRRQPRLDLELAAVSAAALPLPPPPTAAPGSSCRPTGHVAAHAPPLQLAAGCATHLASTHCITAPPLLLRRGRLADALQAARRGDRATGDRPLPSARFADRLNDFARWQAVSWAGLGAGGPPAGKQEELRCAPAMRRQHPRRRLASA